jgi:hypothetical protein
VSDQHFWLAVGLGAALVAIMVLLVVAAMALIVKADGDKRQRAADASERRLIDEMNHLRNLTLRAIAGRDEMAERIAEHSGSLKELRTRVAKLEGGG